MSEKKTVTAAMIIIGDEILSGRTKDANLNHLALWLEQLAIQLKEVRVIPDDGQKIIDTVNEYRRAYDYVFTTGGIGPTHDDITAEYVARAFDVDFIQNQEALQLLEDYYGPGKVSKARQRMTMTPKGALLIQNPVSIAPGFQMENLFVMAGIPQVMQSMLLDIEKRLDGGHKMYNEAIHVFEGESVFSDILAEIDKEYAHVSLGSYPFYQGRKYGATFVLRSQDTDELGAAMKLLKQKITENGSEFFEGEASMASLT